MIALMKRLNSEILAQRNKIIDKINNGMNFYEDRSQYGHINAVKIEGYAILEDHTVCPFYKNNYFCLYGLEIKPGYANLQITKEPVGGMINTENYPIWEAITKYNERTTHSRIIKHRFLR